MATGVLNLHISGLEDNIMRHIATSVHYSWLLPLLHQPQSWPTPDLKTKRTGDMRRLTIKIC